MNLIGPVRIISTRQTLLKSSVKSLDLTLDGNRISKTESERVLGVYIDSHLTWSVHIHPCHNFSIWKYQDFSIENIS